VPLEAMTSRQRQGTGLEVEGGQHLLIWVVGVAESYIVPPCEVPPMRWPHSLLLPDWALPMTCMVEMAADITLSAGLEDICQAASNTYLTTLTKQTSFLLLLCCGGRWQPKLRNRTC